jgi:ribose transport system substrate-binding protein
MTRFNISAGVVVAAVLGGSCIYAVNTVAENSSARSPRILLIGNANGQQWQRTLAGAQAAARKFDVELRFETPALNETAEQQSAVVRKVNLAECDGVALLPVDPINQLALINELASRTKVVTVGNDVEDSKCLCNIEFCPYNAGAKAAMLARQDLKRFGKVALLTAGPSAGLDESTREQLLSGFNAAWARDAETAPHCATISIPIEPAGGEQMVSGLSATLAGAELALLVAFDTKAAESALKAMATWPESERIPIVAVHPSVALLDAIEDGRVTSALLNDPYQDGYEAIERLAIYSRADEAALPIPGFGYIPRNGEIIRKANVADIRRRT